MIDYPANPNVGQQFTAAGVTWTWDGFKWTATGLNTPYLPLSGGTLTGPLYAPADISAPQAIGDNRIINGDMRIDQRNNGASGTANNGYTVDRWRFSANITGKGTWQRGGPISGVTGFPYNLSFVSSSAYVSAAGDIIQFYQPIEADMVSDFQWGTANAQPVTLSFWAASSLTGTFSGAIGDPTGARSYPFSFSVAAGVWNKIAVTIPGDMGGSGVWALSGNAAGVLVHFDLGCGSTYRGPAGAWAGANYNGVTGSVSIVGTNGATLNLTGVKLEVGSVATPFNRQSLAKSLADCQRYCQTSYNNVTIGAISASGQIVNYIYAQPIGPNRIITPVFLNPTMRSSPTVTIYSPVTGASGKARDGSANVDVTAVTPAIGPASFAVDMTVGASTTGLYFQYHYTASAEL